MSTTGSHLHTTTWTVEILIGERNGETHAEARLHTHDRTNLTSTGSARLASTDRDIPEIGDEIAAGRALRNLADRLLAAADEDLKGVSKGH